MGYVAFRHGWNALRLRSGDYGRFILFALTHIYATYVLDLIALQYMSSFKAAFLYNLSPFITAFLSYLYFSEKMTFQKWIGLTLGFAGFFPEMVANYDHQAGGLLFLSYPELMMIGSVITSCIGWVLLRSFVKRDYSPPALNGLAMFFGGLLTAVTSCVFERWDLVSPVTDAVPFYALTALIIVVSNIMLYNLYGVLLKKYTATFISFTGFVIPLLAALFGWFFLGEHISWNFLVSVVLVSAGLWLFYAEDIRQGYVVR